MPTMIRPSWVAETEEQRRAYAEAVRLSRLFKKAEEDMWAAIVKATLLGVPDEPLMRDTGQSRATLNRRYGSRENRSLEPKKGRRAK